MIKIGKKEALYGYVDIILAQLANIIVLPIVLNLVDTEEYAIWNVFVSIQAFVILFESGFSVVVARFTTYAYSGAESIPLSGKPHVKQDFINYDLLNEILFVSKQLYKKIALIASLVLVIATGYIYYIAQDCTNIKEIILAWLIFSGGVALSLYFTFYTSFLKGAGKIKEMRIISIISSIMQAVLKIIFVLVGWGLMGISLAVTIVIIYKRFSIRHHVLRILSESGKETFVIREEKKEEIKRSLNANAKQLGWVVIAQYVENQGTTLICSAFLPLTVIGRYGLTLQILSVIASIAITPTTTFQPVLNQYVVGGKKKELKKLYSLLTVIITMTFWIGTIVAAIFVPYLLNVIHSKTRMLMGVTLIVMAFYQFEIIMHQRATKLISYSNVQPYVKSYILTAAGELIIAVVAFIGFKTSIINYVIGLAIAELYNFVIWVKRAAALVDYSVLELYVNGGKEIVNYIKSFRERLYKSCTKTS